MWSEVPDKDSRKLGSALNYPNFLLAWLNSVEHWLCNPAVGGSSPSASAKIARTPVYIGRVLTLIVRNQD